MPRRTFIIAPFALLSAIGLTGCGGGDGLPRRAISGTVTLDGRPLDRGRIEFRPIGPGTPAGASIEQGSFRVPLDQGPVPGRYRVNISSADEPGPSGVAKAEEESGPGPGPPGATERLPARYNASSTLIAEVKADAPNVFDYPLDSSKSPPAPASPKDQAR